MPDVWFMVEALVALYAHRKEAVKAFSRSDLRAWSDRLKARRSAAWMAIEHLERVGYIKRTAVPAAAARPGETFYTLAPEGLDVAKAANAQRVSEARAAVCKANNAARPRAHDAFIQRLWALLRMRKTLTGPEGAASLVDAGQDVRKASATASDYLRAWQQLLPQQIQVSTQRVEGAVRYVLVTDPGPTAPVIPRKQRAQGGATV